MANTGLRRCLGVDLGSHSVKVADVSMSKSGIVINKVVSADLQLAPGTSESERETTVARVLRDLLKEHKITCKNAVFCVPGQQTFLRRLPPLPQTTEQRLNRIITFEADNLVPFASDQSLRRYQVVESPETKECDVLLAAMKREHIDILMRTVSKTGLKPVMISVGPLALHNFYRFCDTPFVSPEERKRLEKEEAKKKAEEKKKGKKAKDEEEQEEDGEEAGVAHKATLPATSPSPPATEEKKKGFSLAALFKKKGKDKGKDKKDKIAPEDEEATAVVAPGVEELEDGEDAFEDFQETVAYVNLGAKNMDLAIPKIDVAHKATLPATSTSPPATGGALVGMSRLTYGFTRSVPLAGDEMTLAIQRDKQLETFGEAERIKREDVAVVEPELGPEAAPEGVDFDASMALNPVIDKMIIELRRSLDFFISQPDGVAVDAIALSGGHAALPGLREYMEERLGIPVSITSEIGEDCAATVADGEAPSMAPYLVSVGMAIEGLDYGDLQIDFLPDEFLILKDVKKKAPAIAAMVGCLAAMVFFSNQIGARGADLYNRSSDDIASSLGPIIAQKWGDKYKAAEAERSQIDVGFSAIQKNCFLLDNDYWFRFLSYLQETKPTDVVISHLDLGGLGRIQIEGFAEEAVSPARFAKALQKDKSMVHICRLREAPPAPIRSPLFSRPVYRFKIGLILDKYVRLVTPFPDLDEDDNESNSVQYEAITSRPAIR